MLFLHEVHKVKGTKEDEFEAVYRDGWMPTMAETDNARLLWYTNHAMGSGVSYNVITITALSDGAAWEDLAKRIHHGDLQSFMTDLDALRYDVQGKLMLALPWSPMQDLDLASVPTDGATHEPTLYMEDTMWPYEGKYDDYVEISGSVYAKSLGVETERFIEIELGLQPAFSTHLRNEVALMQKIHDTERLRGLLTHEMAPEHRGPGTWMYEGLALRDQWESRLLRTSTWSPLY